MAQVTIHAISTDNQILKGINTAYLREPPSASTIYSDKQTKKDAMIDFRQQIDDEEKKLGLPQGSILISINEGFPWSGILRKAKNIKSKLRSITGTVESSETPIQTAIREFSEEVGVNIPERFFIQDQTYPTVFYLKFDIPAKDVVIMNYKRLLPFTEMYNLSWKKNDIVVPSGPVITPNDITPYKDVDLAINANTHKLSTDVAESVLKEGGRTKKRRKYKNKKTLKLNERYRN